MIVLLLALAWLSFLTCWALLFALTPRRLAWMPATGVVATLVGSAWLLLH